MDEFLELTAIANPHAKLVLVRPSRVTEEEADPLLRNTQWKKDDHTASGEGAAMASSSEGPAIAGHGACGEMPARRGDAAPGDQGDPAPPQGPSSSGSCSRC